MIDSPKLSFREESPIPPAFSDIKDRLDCLAAQYNTPDFILHDPVQVPRSYSRLQDVEVVAFLVSIITWGRRKMVLRDARIMLDEMGESPYDYVMNARFRHEHKSLHRTFMWEDFADVCHALRVYYQEQPSLESLFADDTGGLDMSRYKAFFPGAHVSNWEKGSASKRLHMFLRWMVRNDGIVDIGCWQRIAPSALYIPLDTHVAKTARQFGLLERKSNDRKAVEQLTAVLRSFCPEDPVKYDFALFGSVVGPVI